MLGQIDDAHPTGADLAQNRVASVILAISQWHILNPTSLEASRMPDWPAYVLSRLRAIMNTCRERAAITTIRAPNMAKAIPASRIRSLTSPSWLRMIAATGEPLRSHPECL